VVTAPQWELPSAEKLIKMEPQDFIASFFLACESGALAPSVDDEDRIVRLMRYVRCARWKKMVDYTADRIVLLPKYATLLESMGETSAPFEVIYTDIAKIILSQNLKVSLECISVIETSAASEPVHAWEYEVAAIFLKNCLQTTFPDYRQKFMKSITVFFIRLRTVHSKELRKYDPSKLPEEVLVKLRAPLLPLINFLRSIIEYS